MLSLFQATHIWKSRPEQLRRESALKNFLHSSITSTNPHVSSPSLSAEDTHVADRVVSHQPPADNTDRAAVEFFELKVRPLLVNRCLRCHSKVQNESELRLDSHEALVKGGVRGPAIDIDNPGQSLILEAINRAGELKMPPDKKLRDDEVAVLTKWINEGAVWPAKHRRRDDDNHWAFAPIEKPPIPAVNSDWCATPIDNFLFDAMARKGVRPNKRASRETLIRRVTFDLIGLPPTPEDLNRFLSDGRPDGEAYAAVVDRLLDSPHYGERWGRHWLDVARFADTPGFSSDDIGLGVGVYQDAFTYRDYVIESFNRDLPFDKFICQQLAADLMPESKDDLVTQRALGFLTCGRRDKRDLHEVYDDRIDTVTRGLMGLTVHCARCHDHKIDPIPTADYYSLYGVFASTFEPSPFPELPVKQTPMGQEYVRERQNRLASVNAYLDQKSNEAERLISSKIALFSQAAEGLRRGEFQTADEAGYKLGLDGRWVRLFVERSQSAPTSTVGGTPKLTNGHRNRESDAFTSTLVSQPGQVANGGGMKSISISRDEVRNLLNHEEHRELAALEKQVIELSNSHPGSPGHAMVLLERSPSYEPRVFERGDPQSIGEMVPRRSLKILEGDNRPEFKGDSGRLKLAKEITSPTNPLTARVFVNRIWMHHFGEPLVPSLDNFGLGGMEPTNPDLLDFLASWFIENGWSLKKLHRLLVLSSAYTESSRISDANLALDPNNVLLWRYNAHYLEFEPLRDSLLFVSGRLDSSIGGRSVSVEDSPKSNRRSLYLFVDRLIPSHDQQIFNFPEIKKTVSKRFQTIVPGQNLYMLNSEFMRNCAQSTYSLPEVASSQTIEERVLTLYGRMFGRSADKEDLQSAAKHFGMDLKSSVSTVAEEEWINYIHALLMTNEFSYID
ncbi:PSD1 and planctomycete cytochrome C domain-containing protein [bacterium]|nr:PSD1 and planctomycete cytochrome C domain-containing protein [bacterium]